ncbi:MAG: hypothetical protein IKY74_02020 [Alistipes sp.]|nr:hypothetical protein [Alistipes sp.]
MKKILLSLALCAFVAPLFVGCNKGPEGNNNTPGNVDDYKTPSTLTPGEHKAKLEDIAVEFIGYVDLADFEEILDALYCLTEYLEYEEEDWYGDEYAYNELAMGIKNLSPIHFQRFATRALEEVIIDINDPEYNPLAGYVYEWNGDEWEESEGQSHTIVVKWDDAVATASWGETTRQEWTFRELETKAIVYVPNSLTLNVKIDNKEHLNIVAKPNITDSKTLAPSVEVSLNGGYLISASVKADSRGLETHSLIKKGNKTLLNANTVVAINDLTDVDNWLKTEYDEYWDETETYVDGDYVAEALKSGKVQIDILNLSIVGAGDFKDLLTDIDEITEDLYDDEYDAERWRRKMEDVCDLVNEKVKLVIAYNDTDEKVADIVLQVTRDDEDDYYVEPILLFPDGSKYAFENYFTETAFGDLIDAIEELADDFEDMME